VGLSGWERGKYPIPKIMVLNEFFNLTAKEKYTSMLK